MGRQANTTAAASRPVRAKKAAPPKQDRTAEATANLSKKVKGSRVKKTASAKNSTATKKMATEATSATKKAPAKSKAEAPKMNSSKKRKAADDTVEEKAVKKSKSAPRKKVAPVVKKAPVEKVLKKDPVINHRPTAVMEVLVCGEGSAGELGLGTAKNVVDVKRPRLNANLAVDTVGVVQIAAGGMHAIALTKDNKVLTWGVNDTKALGRNTAWEGGLRDMDAEDDDSDDGSDSGLNPHEATPTEIDLSATTLAPDTQFVKVVGGDSCTLLLTDDGKVYGCGTFRGNDGPFGFTPSVKEAERPILIEGLKNIVDIAAGANHALALDSKGAVFAWGAGEQNQLGRKIVERNKNDSLKPREVGFPRAAKHKIKAIASGQFHCFAQAEDGEVYAWGLNTYGQTGIPENAGEDGAVIPSAQQVKALSGKHVTALAGGLTHTVAATETGDFLFWGRCDEAQSGLSQESLTALGESVLKGSRNQMAIVSVPTKNELVKGHTVAVGAGGDGSFAVTKDGQVYACGFSGNYQTGTGRIDNVEEMTLLDNTAVKERKLIGVQAGGQYTLFMATPKQS